MAKYKFKEGFEYVVGANKITNETLTDDVAIHLLSKGRVKPEDFEITEQVEIKTTKKTKK